MIKVESLTKSIEGQLILEDISFEIKDGEIVVILGRSGTGKSVLLKHLIGLMKPDRGTILVEGTPITGAPERELLNIRKKIGYLFQEGALYDFMDVFDNIAFPLKEHTSMKPNEIAKRVHEVLEMVDLKDVEEKMPPELSGGMKKRVSLGRAIVLKPRILFCDEPTSGLDPLRSRDITDLIRHISKQIKCTTVVTSHDVPNSFRMADRLMLLDEGHIVIMGTKEEIKRSEIPYVQEFFGLQGAR
jgi:phospholipid/cholesterol/gamma-HCH transport system ATP-binding protein